MNKYFDFEQRIGYFGLYGGSFDPIHKGHLYVARLVMERLKLDGVIFLPSGQPPHKQQQRLADADKRLEMVRLAIQDEPDFYYSDFEQKLPPPQYTYLTLEALAKYPARLVFIIGADSLLQLHIWREPRRMLAAAEVAVVQRPGISMEAMEAARQSLVPERVILCPCDGMDASSSQVREGDWRALPERVEAYILKEGLYRE